MAPLRRQPGIVEIEPADHRADVKCRLDGVELELSSGDAHAVRYDGAGNNWPQQFFTGRVFESFQTAAERVEQAVMCGVVGHFRADFVVHDVIDDINDFTIKFRADVVDLS